MTAYYNEHDAKKAAWLRELIARDLIAPGDVDERSIADVRADDLRGYVQCHFFAGIGVWSYAARRAGWPDDRPLWTGSCPCPSFSAAGKGRGFDDPRHLWPEWFRLIRECGPGTVLGEQVAAAIGHGWLDLVCGDLEAEGYAVAPAVLGAHSAGAPHIRQRLYFCAHAGCGATERQRLDLGTASGSPEGEAQQRERIRSDAGPGGEPSGGDDALGAGLEGHCGVSESGVDPDGSTRSRLDPSPRQARLAASGPTATGGGGETKSGGQLDPAYSRWLMGLPPEWCDCAVTAMASLRLSRRCLSSA